MSLTADPAREEAFRREVERFSFGRLPFMPRLRTLGSKLYLTLRLPDVESGVDVEVTFGGEIPPTMPVERFPDLVLALVKDAFAHEVEEQLRIDGVRLWAPHVNGSNAFDMTHIKRVAREQFGARECGRPTGEGPCSLPYSHRGGCQRLGGLR